MKASQFIERYESYCPKDLSLEGDVVGLQIGSLDKDIKTVMFALDIREATVAEAIAKKVDLVIVKHAPIFKPLKDLASSPQNDMYLNLIRHDIAVYVSHTNIDVVPDGLNDWFCDLLDIQEREPLKITKDDFGIGRIGRITPMPLQDLAAKVKVVFDLDSIRLVAYDQNNPIIERVAICGGSGDSFYKEALAKGADVYITGDIYYHTAQDMLTNGLVAIDPGHHIEVLFVKRLVEKAEQWKGEEGWDLTILPSEASTNPFYHL